MNRFNKFVKSLKFKLTVWYSVILSVFCISFVIGMNIWLTEYMNSWMPSGGQPVLLERVDRPRLRSLSEEERLIIMESRMSDLESIREISILMIIPLILFSFAGGYVISGIMLKPLERLNKEIKSKEMENLNEEIVYIDNGDEISELISSFNRMSRRLGRSFEAQKQFVENASHEIKTPLAIMQANLDMVLEGKGVSKEEVRDLVSNSKRQISTMDKLTEDLLLLSMISSGAEISMEPIDICIVLEEVVRDLKGVAKSNSVKIVTKKIAKDCVLNCNRVLLGRAISNILENSLKYSSGSEVVLTVEKEQNTLKLSIEDDGSGIPEDKKDLVFERFYRLDKGRSRKEGGTGLGLSIAREIVELHKGVLYLDEGHKKGARFIMKFGS